MLNLPCFLKAVMALITTPSPPVDQVKAGYFEISSVQRMGVYIWNAKDIKGINFKGSSIKLPDKESRIAMLLLGGWRDDAVGGGFSEKIVDANNGKKRLRPELEALLRIFEPTVYGYVRRSEVSLESSTHTPKILLFFPHHEVWHIGLVVGGAEEDTDLGKGINDMFGHSQKMELLESDRKITLKF